MRGDSRSSALNGRAFRFLSFYYFGSAVIGSVVGTLFKFPPYFLMAPLAFYKKPRIGLLILFFLITNLLVVRETPLEGIKNVEFVGRVKSVSGESATIALSYFDGVRWRRLGFDVKAYVRAEMCEILYARGELRRASGYPRYYIKPSFLATATDFVSPAAVFYREFERFRDFVDGVEPFYTNLFGGSMGRTSRDGATERTEEKIEGQKLEYQNQADSQDEFDQDDFKRSGLYHIFCVSGMHVGMLYLFSSWFVGLLTYRRNVKLLLSLIFPTVFVVGSGLNIPSVRALMMVYVSVAFKLLDLKLHPVNVVSLTGLAMVLANPEIALSLSFYMSYFATLGVLLAEGRRFSKVLSNIGGFLGSAPFVSVFGPVNPFSIIATPLVGIPVQIVMSGLSVAFLLFVFGLTSISKLVLIALLPFVWFVKFVAKTFAGLPALPPHVSVALAFAATFAAYVVLCEEIGESESEKT